jgi:hypothetical protein
MLGRLLSKSSFLQRNSFSEKSYLFNYKIANDNFVHSGVVAVICGNVQPQNVVAFNKCGLWVNDLSRCFSLWYWCLNSGLTCARRQC